MSTEALRSLEATPALPEYRSVLLAVDSSDHADRATAEGIGIAALSGARVTGCHVYAAKLHDQRFRQMEGGLPEQFREERELERQRDVHDDLITRGLSIITDTYLDQTGRACAEADVTFARRSLEGKNYSTLAREANSGDYDLLVLGAQGLGAVRKHHLGTVCARVARRSQIDTLVIKDPERALNNGPLVVAIDGSAKGYGALLTGLMLAQRWNVPLHAISAFDPYYHYVAFNRIARVLSEEAGKVFRFKEQEQLHEEIIDSGLARIYEGHLEMARGIAADHGVAITMQLLTGKPHHVIAQYVSELNPSLLLLGKLGIHADDELDIGGNAELLLQEVGCAVLLGMRAHQPEVERIADVTTSWTHEAEARMARVPSFVRNMARMAILRYAQARGHTVITEKIVEEATANLMPDHAEEAMAEIVAAHEAGELKPGSDAFEPMRWSEAATALLRSVEDLALRGNLSMRAEKKARAGNAATVEREHIAAFLDQDNPVGAAEAAMDDSTAFAASAAPTGDSPHWHAAALARLARAPEGFMRDASRQRIEDYARAQGATEITLSIAEAGLAEARQAMAGAMADDASAKASACPFAELGKPPVGGPPPGRTVRGGAPLPQGAAPTPKWTTEARQRLQAVPAGFCRDMTRKAAETIATQNSLAEITADFVRQVMDTFESGSAEVAETLPWDEAARERIGRAPDMVRGMLAKEIEGWANRNGSGRVTEAAVDAVKALWQERGMFHLDPDDPRSGR